MGTGTGTDRIDKTVVLSAPVERVWRAITDAGEFGRWFGAEFDGPFVRGERVTATVRPTEVDAEVAAHQEAYAGIRFVVWVEEVEARPTSRGVAAIERRNPFDREREEPRVALGRFGR